MKLNVWRRYVRDPAPLITQFSILRRLLAFGENIVLIAHPSKTGGDWWYGTIVQNGKSGFFPKTYAERFTAGTYKSKDSFSILMVGLVTAHALYDYNGGNADELPFSEGDQLSIVENSDADWWKAEQNGMVFIVPAAYLALADG